MHVCRWWPGVLGILVLCGLPVPAAAQAVGSELKINTYTYEHQMRPSVAAAADGSFVVAWTDRSYDGYNYGIFARRYDSAGSPVGAEFQVNTFTSSDERMPAVGSDASGNFLVVWLAYGQDGDSWGIFGQRYDASGGSVGSEFRVNSYTTGYQVYPAIAEAPAGQFVVVWHGAPGDGSESGVFGQRFDASGVAVGAEFQANSYTTATQAWPSVASDTAGAFVVAWHSAVTFASTGGQDGSYSGIFGQRFSANGDPLGAEFRVNTYTTGDQRYPSVAREAAGNFVVVWASQGQDGSSNGIFGQRYDTSGNAVGSEFQANAYTTGAQFRPSVAYDVNGTFVVTWTDNSRDGSESGVFGRRFDSSGSPSGDDFQINSYTSHRQNLGRIASTGNGTFVVAWQSYYQDGGGAGIFGQRLSFASSDTTPPVVTVTAPNGGQTLSYGTPYLIEWTASDDVALDHIDVSYSTDGGTTFSPVLGCTGLADTATSCSWTSPDPATNTGLIRVTATDTSANPGSDDSDANFAVLPGLSVNDVIVSESAGTMTFTVSLSSASTDTVTVKYQTANGTAKSPSDYTAKPLTTLTFTPGQTTKSVTVSVTNDALDEDDEFFFLNLSVPTNAALWDSQGLGTIQDDDAMPSLSINDPSVTEGDSGTQAMTFTVTLSPASGRSVTVNYATADAGSASAPSDYTAKSGLLTFTAGQTSKTLSVTIKGDALDEPDETFNVNLSSAPNATLADALGVGTILNNDSLVGAPSLSISDVTVTEGDSGTTDATFTVSLSGAATQPVTVRYATANGTAMAGTTKDYLTKSGTLTFPVSGGLSQSVTVKVNGDLLSEAAETFFVNLSLPAQATILDGQGLGTIQDNSDPQPSVSIGDASVTEGNSGTQTMTFTVSLSGASGRSITVHYATGSAGAGSGFASAPADYTAKSGTLILTAGQTGKTIVVTIKGDLLVEAAEVFNVDLSLPANAAIGDGQAVGTIVDNDAAAPLASCKAIKVANPGATDGLYVIDPDGAGGLDPVDVQCDMIRDGGGWTLAVKSWYQGGVHGATGAVGSVGDALTLKGNPYKLSDAVIRSLIGGGENFDVLADQAGYNDFYSTGNYEYVIVRDYTATWRFDGPVAASSTTTTFQSYRLADGALGWTGNLQCGIGGAGINCLTVLANNPQGGSGCDINMGTASNAGWHHFYMGESNSDTYLYICNGAQHSSSVSMNHRWWIRER